MKFIAVMLVLTSAAFAKSSCTDLRTTTWTPCGESLERMFVQGKCEETYQVESSYCAITDTPHCIDTRVAFFTPCLDGKTRFFVQGQCERIYQVEHTYCAKR